MRKGESEAKPTGRPAADGVLRLLICLVALVIAAVLLHRLSVLYALDRALMDLSFHLKTPPESSDVVIVDITDDDYKRLFDSTSPLKPKTLETLIDAIAKGGPRVVGVDIDTSAPQFRDGLSVQDWWPSIVWQREVLGLDADVTDTSRLKPQDVLGARSGLDHSKHTAGVGLVLMDPDDKVIRRYQRLVQSESGALDSFPWAVTKAFLNEQPSRLAQLRESGRDLIIDYRGDQRGSHRLHFSASKVLDLSRDWPKSSPIRNKIVLLGGSYLDQDRHDTPLGRMNGVDVMSSIVETELEGGADVPGWLRVVVAHALLFLPRRPSKYTLKACGKLLLWVIGLSLLGDLLTFRSLYGLFYFAALFGLVVGYKAASLSKERDYVMGWLQGRVEELMQRHSKLRSVSQKVQTLWASINP